jgi:hypothetical protein
MDTATNAGTKAEGSLDAVVEAVTRNPLRWFVVDGSF